MIIAVTGGTGFIGRHLIACHLARGDEVRYLTRKTDIPIISGAHAIIGDINDILVLSALVKGVDVLYHCAAELHNTEKMIITNVEGTQTLLDVARGEIKRWVQLSSTGVYGSKPENDVNENTNIKPENDYECSKATADQLVFQAVSKGYFEGVILRPSNVYGVDMSNQSLFQLIKMVKRGWFFFIGKKGAIANYIHIDNVIEALLLCATKPLAAGDCVDYIVSDDRTLEDFIAIIASELMVSYSSMRFPELIVRAIAIMGNYISAFPLRSSRVDALTYKHRYKTTKIVEQLGYQHRVSMEEGIRELSHYAK